MYIYLNPKSPMDSLEAVESVKKAKFLIRFYRIVNVILTHLRYIIELAWDKVFVFRAIFSQIQITI